MKLSTEEAYRTLGLSPEASHDQVRVAYKRLALKYHPDKNPSDDATAMFQKISAAYKRIVDPSSNQLEEENGGDDVADFDFDDMMALFEMMWQLPRQCKHSSKSRGGKSKSKSRRGVNRSFFESQIDLEDMLFGDFFDIDDDFDGAFDAFQACSDSFDEDNEEDDWNDFLSELGKMNIQSKSMFSTSKKTTRRTHLRGRKGRYPLTSRSRRPTTNPNTTKLDSSHEETLRETTVSQAINVGSKVIVYGKLKGEIAFIGPVHYAKGEFIGVILDEACGKNNGMIKGERYFDCPTQHGLMVQRQDITLL
ncbi:hypothetical protein Ae201684P_008206 [Aphanomyces euteiches]|uniref:J domain-containing protein n=1 Tax=Aphanomyces euteiches TaxID=100861 RepID=A0A6G0WEX7_9STRA|nr:hypothetical protein Ae201684_016480 [Aphanomyces euteiches]KAH9092531.1 hypothetical protein Ae201684P_008206 [Aphanomyces euteiches]KAH9134191.1 hypothetical protein AeRB84_019969 [Aphanomyces euteiches]